MEDEEDGVGTVPTAAAETVLTNCPQNFFPSWIAWGLIRLSAPMANAVFIRLWSTPWSSPAGKERDRAPDPGPDPDGVLDPGTRVVHDDSGDSGRVASDDIADEADEDVEPGRTGWVELEGAAEVRAEDWVTEGLVEREMIVVQRDLS